MKKILLYTFLFSFTIQSYATHLMGGEIIATQVNGLEYYIELTAYRDVLGIPMGQTAVFCLQKLNGSGSWVSGQGFSINYDQAISGSMMANMPYGVEIYYFHDTITFPMDGTYMISWEECCRNNAITNMASPGSESMLLQSIITVESSSSNSTPEFLAPPIAYLPINTAFQYNPLPYDADGDSLYWSIDIPLDGSGCTGSGTIVSGYQPLESPMFSDASNPFSLDPITGQIDWTAILTGNFEASYIVEEYRNGTYIGEIRRDMQFVVVPDTNQMASISNMNLIPTNAFDYYYMEIYPNELFELKLFANDPNQSDHVIMEAYGEPFLFNQDGATFSTTQTGNGNEIAGSFRWTPNNDMVREANYITVFRTRDALYAIDESVLINVRSNIGIEEEINYNNNTINQIYPNPTNNFIYLPIYLANNSTISINIYNILGEKVKSVAPLSYNKGSVLLALDIDLKEGSYFISTTIDGIRENTQKVLIVK